MPNSYLEAYTKASTEQEQTEVLREAARHLEQALASKSASALGAVQSLKDSAPELASVLLEDQVLYTVPLELLESEATRNIILKWCDVEEFLPSERSGRSTLDGE